MIPADNHRDAALASVELNEEGFFVHPEQWTKAMVPALAARVGIRKLSDRHWQVIRFTRHQFLDTGAGLYACKASVDLFGLTKEDFIPQAQDIITVGEFYEKAAGGQIIFT